jgi:hypothetical protein
VRADSGLTSWVERQSNQPPPSAAISSKLKVNVQLLYQSDNNLSIRSSTKLHPEKVYKAIHTTLAWTEAKEYGGRLVASNQQTDGLAYHATRWDVERQRISPDRCFVDS